MNSKMKLSKDFSKLNIKTVISSHHPAQNTSLKSSSRCHSLCTRLQESQFIPGQLSSHFIHKGSLKACLLSSLLPKALRLSPPSIQAIEIFINIYLQERELRNRIMFSIIIVKMIELNSRIFNIT